jgi:Ser-tRNA(Ala) deacylase AlaX
VSTSTLASSPAPIDTAFYLNYLSSFRGTLYYADKAYNDCEIEDLLQEVEHIHLLPMRKKNSKRALPTYISFVQSYHRKRVETAGSLIEQLLPKPIHAVTSQGFELKVALFVMPPVCIVT